MKLKQICLVLSLFLFQILLSCGSHNNSIDKASIKEIIESRYNSEVDSIVLLSKEDCNHSYFAVHMVDDLSSNMFWWECGLQSEDSLQLYSFFDFVGVVIEQCDNIDNSISIINKAMIDQDFQWQCTPIDNTSYCSYYSMHALALVVSNRKMQFFHSKDLVSRDYEAMPNMALNGIIESWLETTYGFSPSCVFFRMRDSELTAPSFFLIRAEHVGQYAYALLMDLDRKYIFSLEDVCGQYSKDSKNSYTTESFAKLIDVILSSSIPNTQKHRWIKSIVDLANEYRVKRTGP